MRLTLSLGFRLGMVGQIRHYDFSDPTVPLDQALAEVKAVAQGYEVISIEGVPAKEPLDDVAVLKERMSLDTPSGELPQITQRWDAARVVDFYTARARTARVFIALAVETGTGRVVAISELMTDRAPENPVHQWDILVLPEHRRHRLGMLVKAANLQALHASVPQVRFVQTYNSAENGPMLAVNDALGFRTHLVSGHFTVSRDEACLLPAELLREDDEIAQPVGVVLDAEVRRHGEQHEIGFGDRLVGPQRSDHILDATRDGESGGVGRRTPPDAIPEPRAEGADRQVRSLSQLRGAGRVGDGWPSTALRKRSIFFREFSAQVSPSARWYPNCA